MKFRISVLIALPMMFAAAACTMRAAARGDDDAATVARLTAQAEQWDRAIVRKDRDAIAANMSDDFRPIRATGGVANRQQFLDFITSPELSIDPYTVDDLNVRIHGDAALVSGTTRMSGRYAGTAFTSYYRFVDVYLRQDGVWRVCNVQITTIAE